MHSTAFSVAASSPPAMEVCVSSRGLILRFTRFLLSLTQSLLLLDLCQVVVFDNYHHQHLNFNSLLLLRDLARSCDPCCCNC